MATRGAGTDASSDSGDDAGAEASPDCGFHNSPACPPLPASTAEATGPCAPVGLDCTYWPGWESSANCQAPTVRECTGDAGADAGSWTFFQ